MGNNLLRKHIHDFVDRADEHVLQVVYKLLEANVTTEDSSYFLSEEQEKELARRVSDYNAGKGKNFSRKQAKQMIAEKMKK